MLSSNPMAFVFAFTGLFKSDSIMLKLKLIAEEEFSDELSKMYINGQMEGRY